MFRCSVNSVTYKIFYFIWPIHIIGKWINLICKSYYFSPKREIILFEKLGWLAHLVSRFACNTKVIVDASSSPPVSRIKIAATKT